MDANRRRGLSAERFCKVEPWARGKTLSSVCPAARKTTPGLFSRGSVPK